MSSPDDVSPEEKLLKVIQEGDGKQENDSGQPGDAPAEAPSQEPAAAAVESAVDVEAESVRPSTPPEDSDIAATAAAGAADDTQTDAPRLRLAKTAEGEETDAAAVGAAVAAEAGGTDDETAEEDDATGQMIGQNAAPASGSVAPALAGLFGGMRDGRSGMSGIFSIGAVNKCLAVIVFLLLCLVVFEICSGLGLIPGSNVEGVPSDAEPGGRQDVAADVAVTGLRAFPDVLRQIREREDIFSGEQEKVVIGPPPPPPPKDWVAYIKKNMELVAVSLMKDASNSEVILKNRETAESFYLKVDDAFTVEEHRVHLKKLSRSEIVLSDGSEEVSIQ